MQPLQIRFARRHVILPARRFLRPGIEPALQILGLPGQISLDAILSRHGFRLLRPQGLV